MISSGRNATTLSTGAVLMTSGLHPFKIAEINERWGGDQDALLFDGTVFDDGAGNVRQMTPEEREQLARYMGERWKQWAAR